MISEYTKYDALGLAALVRNKEVSAEELLNSAIEMTEALDPIINAIPLKHYDKARMASENVPEEGSFVGVPFLLKDLNNFWEGTVTTGGSRILKGIIADHTGELVKRALDAGLVIFGKTNSPEQGLTITTEPVLYGPCRNPWNLNHSTGGSSGGSAAAVAAGIVPMAQASDGGGSIRIPASCCGLFGLKPTRARTPLGPSNVEGWGGNSIFHCVSISVRDSAALLDATSGAELGAPYRSEYQSETFLSQLDRRPKNLRIAYIVPDSIPVDSDVMEVMDKTIKLCEDLGHSVEKKSPEFSWEEIGRAHQIIVSANVAYAVSSQENLTGIKASEEVLEKSTLKMAENGESLSAEQYVAAIKTNQRIGQVLARFLLDYDIILSPVLAKAPVEIGYLDMNSQNLRLYRERMEEYSPFTPMFNQSGLPSMSVPLYRNSNNLPIGSMFSAAFGQEGLLFGLAAQLEEALPWGTSYQEIREKLTKAT